MFTPWGRSDGQHTHAPGIVQYYTSSHGGIHLTPARVDEACRRRPDLEEKIRTRAPWYEEDCDALLVAAVWPDLWRSLADPATIEGMLEEWVR